MQQENKDKVFYFLLDYKKTKAAIKTKIDQYNDDLKLFYDANVDEFRKRHKLTPNQTYKACTLKSAEETTMWCILEMFGGYLQNNAITKIMPEAFMINNKAISTKKSSRINVSTSYRHLNRLIECGIITEKIFRGSNTSFEIKLNQNLIHFRPNSDYNFHLADIYRRLLGDRPVKAAYFNGLFSFSATLANFPFGVTLASCNDTSTRTVLLEHKINMECGIVDFDLHLHTPSPSEDQNNNADFDKDWNKESQKSCHSERGTPPNCAPPPQDFEKDYTGVMLAGKSIERAENQKKTRTIPISEDERLWKEVLSFYCYAIAILWPDRIITQYERNRVCLNIFKQFKKQLGDNPVYPNVYSFRGTFMFRILLTKKYLNKNPLWTLESPLSYFDFTNVKGFNGTEGWVDRSKQMEAQNKLYLEHYRKFIQGWKDYTKNPSVETYRQVSQQLGKMKNNCWINYFNQGVANLNSLETNGLREMWKNHYAA